MVTILLASYNGENYLAEQLDSLLKQTYTDFNIIVSDDGSTDGTPEIIENYVKNNPGKISTLGGETTGSAKRNFIKLLLACDSDYVMFCDQDDYWKEDKIEITLDRMKKLEKEYPDMPLLVHTDLEVADAQLNVISKSFFDFQKISPERNELRNVLVQNNVTGCTVMINRKLADMVRQHVPENCVMHDWWLNLVATAFGKVDYISRPTMLYRQHGDNQVGAKKATGVEFLVNKFRNRGNVRKNYIDSFRQAKNFVQIYKRELSPQQRETVEAFASLGQGSKLSKIKTINKYNFRKNTFVRTVGQYFSI